MLEQGSQHSALSLQLLAVLAYSLGYPRHFLVYLEVLLSASLQTNAAGKFLRLRPKGVEGRNFDTVGLEECCQVGI